MVCPITYGDHNNLSCKSLVMKAIRLCKLNADEPEMTVPLPNYRPTQPIGTPTNPENLVRITQQVYNVYKFYLQGDISKLHNFQSIGVPNGKPYYQFMMN